MKFQWLKTVALILFTRPHFLQFFTDSLIIPDTLSGQLFNLNMTRELNSFTLELEPILRDIMVVI
jgi:hypothetical protein